MSFSFGAPATQAAGFNFGAPKTVATVAPTFGASAAAPAFGAAAATSTFGAPAATTFGAPAAAAPTFGAATASFGMPAATAPSFGAQANTAAPAFGGFGATGAPPPAFGATSSAATTLNFGTGGNLQTTAQMPTLNFGAGQATSTVPTLGLGGGALSFGKPAAAPSLNFGTTTTSVSGGLFGKPATSISATTAPTPFVGLGGIDISSTQPKAGDSKQDHIKIKETQVPDEIAKTVDALKAYIKTQKTYSSDIGRTSTSKLTNVSSEITNLQWALREIANSAEVNYNQIKLLRKETTKVIQSVEMAQRTQDTPAGLQYENTAPFQYFQSLVAKYEKDLINFRQQIAQTERHMLSLATPQSISPEDLKRGLLQINESFISLAGRLHEIHQKVEAQKEQYLNLRKYRLRDATNVFEKLDKPEASVNTTRITSGPTPFSNISGMSSFGKSLMYSTTGGGSAGHTGK